MNSKIGIPRHARFGAHHRNRVSRHSCGGHVEIFDDAKDARQTTSNRLRCDTSALPGCTCSPATSTAHRPPPASACWAAVATGAEAQASPRRLRRGRADEAVGAPSADVRVVVAVRIRKLDGVAVARLAPRVRVGEVRVGDVAVAVERRAVRDAAEHAGRRSAAGVGAPSPSTSASCTERQRVRSSGVRPPLPPE